MDAGLLSIVLERLDADQIDAEVELQVLAACEGRLDQILGDGAYTRPTARDVAAVEPPGVYLGGIAVEGFRGIGDRRTLPLHPGPGLTLVVGRNGSGKSSFAEAAEMLFTGTNRRWASRPPIWQDGWRNLHHRTGCAIAAALAIDGEAGSVTLRRQWSDDAALDDTTTVVDAEHGAARDLAALGWDRAVIAYRPFLSYNELGSMLEGKPSELHDAMSSILGLDELEQATRALGDAKRVRARQLRDARAALAPLLDQLAATDDERAGRCHRALSARTWDLDALDEVLLAEELDADAGGVLATLRGLASLDHPSAEQVEKAARELAEAQAQVDELSGTEVGRANTLVQVLTAAIQAHEVHGDQDCPVCGGRRLDDTWRAAAGQEVERLRREAADARAALARLRTAVQDARRLAADPPDALLRGGLTGVDTHDTVAAWRRFAQLPDAPADVARHLEQHHPALVDAVAATRAQAVAELDRRNATWLPLARELTQWSATAREALVADATAKQLAAGERWVKEATADLRDERFRPIADQARALWEQLRQQSNVQLDDVALTGAATRRALSLDVSVDGADGSALGVMSQGELHALALSLFLPRATLPESPFRFLVIDDPVQSMDPARVDGLARVLDQVARDRQVIVFTHDDRLPESVRRLEIDARVLGVTRRPRSKVDVHEELEPVTRYLSDAYALARSDRVPDDIVSYVVPGLCRAAIEAACQEAIRRRWITAGVPHAEIERRLEDAKRTRVLTALALFDDAEQHGAVMSRLNALDRRFADAFRWTIDGAHHGVDGTHRGAVLHHIEQTGRLTTRLRSAA